MMYLSRIAAFAVGKGALARKIQRVIQESPHTVCVVKACHSITVATVCACACVCFLEFVCVLALWHVRIKQILTSAWLLRLGRLTV